MDPEFVEELQRRLMEARVAAQDACADAELLLEVSAALKSGAITARCAWCGSYRVRERWLRESQMPRSATSSRGLTNVSHSICPPCIEELRAAGLSV